jgi:predicted transcriptional regulator
MLKLTGNLEQEIMNILWEAQTALKPAEVQGNYPGELAYTTVMTVLQRLHRKGILSRERDGNAYRYSPRVSKDAYANNTLDQVYKGILAAYGPLAIAHFIESVRSDPQHRDLLQKYLQENE